MHTTTKGSMKALTGVVLFLLAACGDDPVNRCGDALPATFVLSGAPASVVYRTGAGWIPLAATRPGVYELCFEDRFEVAAVCPRSDGSGFIQHHARGAGEATTVYGYSCEGDGSATTFEVSVQMQQPGAVWLNGANSRSATAPWDFTAELFPGDLDVVASSDFGFPGVEGRVAVRRDLEVSQAMVLDPIDLAVEGQPLETTDLVVEGMAADDGVLVESRWILDERRSRQPLISQRRDALVASLVPASLLRPTDAQVISLYVGNGELGRSSSRRYPWQGPFVLMPRLTGVTLELSAAPRAVWTELPSDYTSAELYVTGDSFYMVTANRAWIDAQGAASLAIDTAVPGIDPSWAIDPATARASFAVYRERDGETARSSVSSVVP